MEATPAWWLLCYHRMLVLKQTRDVIESGGLQIVLNFGGFLGTCVVQTRHKQHIRGEGKGWGSQGRPGIVATWSPSLIIKAPKKASENYRQSYCTEEGTEPEKETNTPGSQSLKVVAQISVFPLLPASWASESNLS